jgi:hypothetical protein
MKKITIITIIVCFLYSCESKRENCIRGLVDKEDYSYDDACEACDDMATDVQHE